MLGGKEFSLNQSEKTKRKGEVEPKLGTLPLGKDQIVAHYQLNFKIAALQDCFSAEA